MARQKKGSEAKGESTSFKAHCLPSMNASMTTPQTPLPSSCRISTVTGFEGGKLILTGRAYILLFFSFLFSESFRLPTNVDVS